MRKKTMKPKLKMTIEKLAVMTARGFAEISEKMATKDDIRQIRAEMATKDDLKNFATKEDLQEIKDEMATKTDIARLESKLVQEINSVTSHEFREHREIKQRIEKLERAAI